MSSHHIVRDEQEPALVLWEPDQLTYEQVGELLGWSPRVVVHKQAAKEVLGWGIKADALCGTPNTLEELSSEFSHQEPLAKVDISSNNALAEVLNWLAKQNHKAANITLPAYGQAQNLWQQCQQQAIIQIGILSGSYQYFWVKDRLSKWLPEGSSYILIEEGKSAENHTTTRSGEITIERKNSFWLGWKLV